MCTFINNLFFQIAAVLVNSILAGNDREQAQCYQNLYVVYTELHYFKNITVTHLPIILQNYLIRPVLGRNGWSILVFGRQKDIQQSKKILNCLDNSDQVHKKAIQQGLPIRHIFCKNVASYCFHTYIFMFYSICKIHQICCTYCKFIYMHSFVLIACFARTSLFSQKVKLVAINCSKFILYRDPTIL